MTSAFTESTFTTEDGLQLYYRDYNPSAGGVPILCLPGLTRNAKDFEDVAPQLVAWGYRVLCMDMRGRGKSDYDPDPENYHPHTYARDVLELFNHEHIGKSIVIGTSLGGLVAMTLALLKPEILHAVVLNDVGPDIAPEGLVHIAKYAGKSESLPNWDVAAGAAHLVGGHAYPDFTEADWQDMARRVFREQDDGNIVADCDPQISLLFDKVLPNEGAPNYWDGFMALSGRPVMCIWGKLSNILAENTLSAMRERMPDMTVVTLENRGHVPLLTEAPCIEGLGQFLGALSLERTA